jgi:hypothetical protein
MRVVIVGLCLFATACSSPGPTSPTSPTASSSHIAADPSVSAAQSGSALPFEGNLRVAELVDGDQHHLVGGGNSTHLGRFTYAAEIVVDAATGNGAGTVTWTAANGDTILARTAGAIVGASDSGISIRETQTITSGTGRFRLASGTVVVTRTLEFATGSSNGSFTGTINLRH